MPDAPAPILYRDADADVTVLVGRRVAILGYGRLGRAFALNMRDSGLPLIIGNRADDYEKTALADGFQVMSIADAAAQSDILLMLLPDEIAPQVYTGHVSRALRPGTVLAFASGYNIAFGYIEPPRFVDVVLIAPRTISAGVREGYLSGTGYLSVVAVEQDVSGQARDLALALAQTLGALHQGALEGNFRQEAELDLFVQQAVLPAIHSILSDAAEVLVNAGYPPAAAMLDLYRSGEIGYTLNKTAEQGTLAMLSLYSRIAQYGILSRAERLHDPRQRRLMERALDDIRDGRFAEEWTTEAASGYHRLDSLRRKREQAASWEREGRVTQAIKTPRRPLDDLE